ncbi:MAG: SDR family NAD(P)-dependent oxidoreductase [Opitutales bacterium]|jgi:short-subunit dehydrogenase
MRPIHKRSARFLAEFDLIVVTGGSSGIGRAFLRRIEESAPNAVVCNVSRTAPTDWPTGPQRVHLAADLSKPAEIEGVAAALRKLMPGKGRMLLVNNSGFGAYGEFPAPDLDHTTRMIDVNCRAPVQLTGLLWPDLLARGGMVANVASLAAYQPVPLMATYAATKAFLLHWSIALDTEGRDRGVRCVAVCPGPVSTNFFRGAGFSQPTGLPGQSAEDCVDEALAAMTAHRPQVVTGLSNRLVSWFSARLPKPWASAIGLRAIQRKLGRTAR